MNDRKSKVVLVGFTGAGKTTAAQQLGERYGYTVISTHAPLLYVLGKTPGEIVPGEQLIEAAVMVDRDHARYPYGVAGLTFDYIAHHLPEEKLGRIVVDCMRYPPDVRRFLDREWHVLGIRCEDQHVRLQRLIERRDPKDAHTSDPEQQREYVHRKMQQDIDLFGVLRSLEFADTTIYNERTVSDLYGALDRFVHF